MKDLIKLLPYLLQYKKNIIIVFICNILAAIFSFGSIATIIPFLSVIFETTNEIISPVPFEFSKDAIQHNMNYFLSSIIIEDGKSAAIIYICVFLVIISLLKNIFEYFSHYFNIPVINGVPKDIYNAAYQKILILPVFYFTNERKGDIMSRMSADITEIRNSMVSSFRGIIKYPIFILVYFIGLIFISWQMTIIITILLPVTAIITGKIGKSLKKTSRQAQEYQGDILVFIDETLSGLKIIKLFQAITHMNNRFRSKNHQYYKTMNAANRRQTLASPLTESLITFTLAFAIYYGGTLVLTNNGMSAEGFIAYLIAFTQIVSPAKSLTNSFYGIKRGSACVERIEKIIDANVSIKDTENPKTITEFKENICFNNVSFSYNEERTILNNINLNIKKGTTIALVGQSGSGKTTIAQLLPRFHEVNEGTITIDNIPISEYKLEDIRMLMGMVTQESILFNDTIFNNIAFGVESPDKQKVIDAAKLANAHEFIIETEHGYDTIIGDQGSKLSGGQRQRLSIARAIMKNPQILILDEATSALDTQSERLVQDALENLMKDRTSLVIAHRLSTIKNADTIIVLSEGKIVEQGTHTELIKKQGAYKQLHDLQLI